MTSLHILVIVFAVWLIAIALRWLWIARAGIVAIRQAVAPGNPRKPIRPLRRVYCAPDLPPDDDHAIDGRVLRNLRRNGGC